MDTNRVNAADKFNAWLEDRWAELEREYLEKHGLTGDEAYVDDFIQWCMDKYQSLMAFPLRFSEE